MKEEIKYENPTFCKVGFSRLSCNGKKLFGSSVTHDIVISLKIWNADYYRRLNEDSVLAKKELIEVYLSKSQFTDLLTSFNYNDGVPCTLSFYNDEYYKMPDLPTKSEQFKSEIKNHVLNITKQLDDVSKKLSEHDKPIGKKDKLELQSLLNCIKNDVSWNMEFILDQFQKQMNITVSEAKTEIEEFFNNKFGKCDIDSLKSNILKIEDK